MKFLAIEAEPLWQWETQRLQTLQRFFPPRVTRDLEFPVAGNGDFDVVAFLQLQGVDDRLRQADGETVAPFRDLHLGLQDIRRLRISKRRQRYEQRLVRRPGRAARRWRRP